MPSVRPIRSHRNMSKGIPVAQLFVCNTAARSGLISGNVAARLLSTLAVALPLAISTAVMAAPLTYRINSQGIVSDGTHTRTVANYSAEGFLLGAPSTVDDLNFRLKGVITFDAAQLPDEQGSSGNSFYRSVGSPMWLTSSIQKTSPVLGDLAQDLTANDPETEMVLGFSSDSSSRTLTFQSARFSETFPTANLGLVGNYRLNSIFLFIIAAHSRARFRFPDAVSGWRVALFPPTTVAVRSLHFNRRMRVVRAPDHCLSRRS